MRPLVLGGAHGHLPKTGASSNAWFGSAVRADKARGLGDYAAAPPRGMTNPPQNPAVRQALLQELIDYGIVLEARNEWPPPPNGPLSPGTPSAPPLTELGGYAPPRYVMLAKEPSSVARGSRAGAGLGGRAPGSQSLPQLQSLNAAQLADRPSWGVAKKQEKPRHPPEMPHAGQMPGEASGSRRPGPPLLPLQPPMPQSALRYASAPPDSPALSPSAARLHERLQLLRFRNESPRAAEGRQGSESPPAAAIDTGRNSNASGDKKEQGAAFPTGMSKKILDDHQIDNALLNLRSRGRLHQVTVTQNLDQVTEFEGGKNIIIAGAPPWQSDGARLVTEHNKAMRHQNPSNLARVHVEPTKKHKKKHKRVVEDEDASNAMKYSSDSSVRRLQELQNIVCPPSRVSDIVIAEALTAEQVKQNLVDSFKAGLNIKMDLFRG